MDERYDHKTIETKQQNRWERDGLFSVIENASRKKMYILDMFPYPSAQGLHVGHPEGYTASDIVSRYLRMKGNNVLHPMGFDSFGLPAENYAIRTGTHPRETTIANIDNMRRQIKRLGFSYDWSREVITSDPQYYKWTQWIFVQLFKHGLAYEDFAPINWCPSCKTGLANEEVINGKCERCGNGVVKKQIKQWLVKITDKRYIERLLNDLDDLDWPESVKSLQRNWIGRSEGVEVNFAVKGRDKNIRVFTTRPDTLFGVTYMILSPEHELVDTVTTDQRREAVEKYKEGATAKSDLERTDLAKEKTGVFTGGYAINPVNNEEIPIWIADYVLASYGTGAIMAVPAHDERDYTFARKFKLPIVPVIEPHGVMSQKKLEGITSKISFGYPPEDIECACWTGDGIMINSEGYDGLDSLKFKEKITTWLEKNKLGRKTVNYKLRDWLFSRQRYWGEPIPLVHCEYCAKEYKQTFLLVHGLGGTADENWFPWLREELERLGHRVISPTLPKAAEPHLNEWLLELKKYKKLLGDNVVVIAHSLGAPAACKFIEQEKLSIKKLFLVAPAGRTLDDGILNKLSFSKKQISSIKEIAGADIDWQKLKKFVKHRFIYLSDNDPYIPLETKNDFEELSAQIKVFKNKGHFNSRAGVSKFPEILEDIHPLPVGLVPVPEKDLPVELPKVEKYEPTGSGESPLADISDWVNTKCPQCGGPAKRETNTMPQWAGSNWYWLRYCDPHNNKRLADPEKLKYWLPVDIYVGGAEHAVLHLLYARFIYKFLYDIGVVPKEAGDEPFTKLKNQGIILGGDGVKMSKSRGNVINPDDVIREYGADTMRLYEMFMGPFEDSKPWDTKGIIGMRRFLERVWREIIGSFHLKGCARSKLIHQTIKKVTEDIDNFKFNTAISSLMIFFNKRDWRAPLDQDGQSEGGWVDIEAIEQFLILLSPFAPHITEELWEKLGHRESIFKQSWPVYDPELIKEEKLTYVVQINGKVRDNVIASAEATKEEIKKLALSSEKVQKYMVGEVIRVVFVPGKLINFVI